MSGAGEKTLAGWRAEAVQTLATAARKLGLDGLRRVKGFKPLLNIVEGQEIERAMPAIPEAPSEAALVELERDAKRLAAEYARVKARDGALPIGAQETLPLGTALDPPPPAVVDESPQRPGPALPDVTAPSPAPPKPAGTAPGRRPVLPYLVGMSPDPLFTQRMPVREVTEGRSRTPRDLSSDEAVQRIRKRQIQALTAFFAPAAPPEGSAAQESAASWSAHLELGEGLEVVAGPLAGLPGFVRTLEIVAGETRTTLIAANARSGVARAQVPASTADYQWSAGDFDDELRDELAALKLPGFPADRATAFRVDADGAGQRLDGNVLAPGRTYRLLLPPGISLTGGVAAGEARALPGEGAEGWRVLELAVPADAPAALGEALEKLKLRLAPAALEVDFVGLSPREYRAGRAGERYPCFRPGDAAVVRVAGGAAGATAVTLFLAGPAGQQWFALPEGEAHRVQIGPLPAGRYALDALSEDPRREPERLFFEVDPLAGREVPARASLVLRGEAVAIHGEVIREVDLSGLREGELLLCAPALWRVGARWEGARSRPLPPRFADAAGEVDMAALLAALETEREQEQVGDLALDLGDLGRVLLQHTRPISPEATREGLARLMAQRGASLEAADDLGLVRAIWVEPAFRILGYRVVEVPPLGAEAAAGPLLTLALETTFRGVGRMMTDRPLALLIARRGADLRASGAGSVRAAAGQLAQRDGFSRVVLTDGLSFGLWERGRAWAPPPLDLREVLADEGRFVDFMTRFHA